MPLPPIDPTWAVVFMLLAFCAGLIGGARLTANMHNNRMNRF